MNNPVSLTRSNEFIPADYRQLFRESPLPMYIFNNEDHRFIEVNQAAIAHYGFSEEEFLQLGISDLRLQGDVDAFIQISHFLPDQFYDAGRWVHRNKAGELFSVHIYFRRLCYQGLNATMALAINVQKQVLAERDLQEQIAETARILDSITNGFFTVDQQWKLTYVNKEFERITGCSRKELTGKILWKVLSPSKEKNVKHNLKRVMNKQEVVHFEIYYAERNKWLAVDAYPAKDGIAVYFVDVSEQKSHLQKIQHQNETLKKIAWTNSHKVRNHVANIVGLTSLFSRNNDEEFTEDLIAKLQDSATQLDLIIKEIVHSTV